MPKALILNGNVVDIVEQEFDVHSDFTWVDCDSTVTTKHTYDGSAFVAPASPTAAEQLDKLRSKRDVYLSRSDWTQGADSPLTDAQKTEWATYRQALRDITETYSSIDDVVWPTKPE